MSTCNKIPNERFVLAFTYFKFFSFIVKKKETKTVIMFTFGRNAGHHTTKMQNLKKEKRKRKPNNRHRKLVTKRQKQNGKE